MERRSGPGSAPPRKIQSPENSGRRFAGCGIVRPTFAVRATRNQLSVVEIVRITGVAFRIPSLFDSALRPAQIWANFVRSGGQLISAIHSSSHRFSFSRFFALSLLAVCTALSLPQAGATAAPTTTTLSVTSGTTEVTSVAAGTVVTLTATVVSGSTPVNPGSVSFCVATAAHCEDSALLATAQLTTAGKATYKFRPGIGSHSYQAVFFGTGTYAKSTSTAAALTVPGPYPTTTTLTSSGSIGDYALTATVVGSGSTLPLEGNVSFLDTTNGNASLGTAALQTAGQSFAVSSVPVPGNEPL